MATNGSGPGLWLRIEQHGLDPWTARVWLDDHEISKGLTGLTLRWSPQDNVTTAELTIMVDRLEVDAETLAVLTAHVVDKPEPVPA